ncbi:hypothetical protein JCM6882_005291 [Rhodosporidiobolus microsporus]
MTAAQNHPYGFSPNSSASAEFDDALDPLAFDEDDLPFGDDEEASFHDQDQEDDAASARPASKGKKSSNRKGPHNVEKRATHNATERARRDNLNTRFMNLAGALPTMRNIKRPSKAVIITKALDFVYDSQVREHTLVTENNDLRREVDQLRARLGMEALPPPAPLPEPKMATQSTMRKTKKQQAARAARAAALVEPEPTPKVESPVPTFAPAAQQAPSPATPQTTASPHSYAAATHPSPNGSASSSVARTSSGIFDSAASPQVAAPTFPPHATFFSASPPSHTVDALSSSPVVAAPTAPVSTASTFAPAPPAFYAPGAPQPNPTHTLAYHAMLAPQSQAAAMLHAQQLAGYLASPSAAAAPQPNSAAAMAAFMNPQFLFAFQQQQQQQHQQAQAAHMPQLAYLQQQPQPHQGSPQEWMPTPPGSCGGGVGVGVGMFATSVDGLGF